MKRNMSDIETDMKVLLTLTLTLALSITITITILIIATTIRVLGERYH